MAPAQSVARANGIAYSPDRVETDICVVLNAIAMDAGGLAPFCLHRILRLGRFASSPAFRRGFRGCPRAHGR